MADQLVINSATPIGSGRFYYKLDTNQGEYYYTPVEFLNQGLLQGNTQFFESGFIRNPDITKNLKSVEIAPGVLQEKISGLYQNPNRGVLLTRDQASKVLGTGKETFSNWDNVANSGGFVDLYDITEVNKNTGSPYGPIGGMGEFQGNLVYTRPTEAGKNYSYIVPSDTFDTGHAMRNTTVTVEKKGGLLGDIVRGVGEIFGSIPVIGDIAAYALGGPGLLGVVKGGQVASAGGSPMDAFKAGAVSGAVAGGAEAFKIAGGFGGAPTEVSAAPGVEVFPVAAPAPVTVTPITGTEALAGTAAQTAANILAQPATNYGLLGGSIITPQPAELAGAGGTGISVSLPPLPEPSAIGTQPIDYSLIGQTVPGVVGGIGLQQPTMPNIGVMGGGQGITVPVEAGTVGALGLTPTGATPVLGSPESFINKPEVLGQDVIQQGTPTPSSISVQDALRGARLVNSLLNPPQAQTPNMLNRAQEILKTQGAVDYTTLLGLLSQRASTPGLLGTRYQPQSINLASLLG